MFNGTAEMEVAARRATKAEKECMVMIRSILVYMDEAWKGEIQFKNELLVTERRLASCD
jgi:hypothetical protein